MKEKVLYAIESIKTVFDFFISEMEGCSDFNKNEIMEERDNDIDLLKRMLPEPIEMEGGGSSWWYVCPECHGAIDRNDRFCRHCGQAVTNEG